MKRKAWLSFAILAPLRPLRPKSLCAHQIKSNQTCSSKCSRSQGEMTFMNSAYSISLISV